LPAAINATNSPIATTTCENFNRLITREVATSLNLWGGDMTAKALTVSTAVACLFFGAIESAQANPVDVSVAISSSGGNWFYDFSVKNNLGGTNDIYALWVNFPQDTNASFGTAPTNWVEGFFTHIEWCYSGANCSISFSNLTPGDTLSGFIAKSTVQQIGDIGWHVAAAGGDLGNPVFQGTALVSSSAVPLPASLPLLGGALGGLGIVGRWRKRRVAAA